MKKIYAEEQVEELIEQTRERAFLAGFEEGYRAGEANTRGSCCNNCPRSKENERSVNSAKP